MRSWPKNESLPRQFQAADSVFLEGTEFFVLSTMRQPRKKRRNSECLFRIPGLLFSLLASRPRFGLQPHSTLRNASCLNVARSKHRYSHHALGDEKGHFKCLLLDIRQCPSVPNCSSAVARGHSYDSTKLPNMELLGELDELFFHLKMSQEPHHDGSGSGPGDPDNSK